MLQWQLKLQLNYDIKRYFNKNYLKDLGGKLSISQHQKFPKNRNWGFVNLEGIRGLFFWFYKWPNRLNKNACVEIYALAFCIHG